MKIKRDKLKKKINLILIAICLFCRSSDLLLIFFIIICFVFHYLIYFQFHHLVFSLILFLYQNLPLLF